MTRNKILKYISLNVPAFAGAAGATVMLVTYFLLWQPVVSIIAGAALFGGVLFLGHDWALRQLKSDTRNLTLERVTEKIAASRQTLAEIEDLLRGIGRPEIREKIGRIASLAQRIFAKIEQNPEDTGRAGAVLLCLEQVLELVRQYTQILPDRGAKEEFSTGESAFLAALGDIDAVFSESYRSLVEDDSIKLASLSDSVRELLSVQKHL